MHPLLIVFLLLFLLSALMGFVLNRLNIAHLKKSGHKAPEVFAGEVDQATLSSMNDYTIANSRLETLQSLAHDALTLFILLSGIISWLALHILSLDQSLIVSGICFFLFFSLLSGLLGIPFELYSVFVIEKRFGFSTITWKTWLGDLIKTAIISAVLLGIMWSALLGLIDFAPQTWWIWMWGFFVAFELVVMVLYPVLIAPLFNKFLPLDDPELVEGIQVLLDKSGLKTKGIFRVDALKRSRHSNAYFTGMGKTKRIVLYDTLLNAHSREEILAVLAHEIGHWKHGHVRKQLLLMLCVSLGAFYLCWWLINWPGLYLAFGIHVQTPYIGILILSLIVQPLSLFLMPLMAGISRRYERQADDYANMLMGGTSALITALKRLAKENLANLYPHPLYAWFHYSHPPMVERIERLQSLPVPKEKIV